MVLEHMDIHMHICTCRRKLDPDLTSDKNKLKTHQRPRCRTKIVKFFEENIGVNL